MLLPLLLNFGLLELFGTLLTKVMRPVFNLPGRSAIDCMASWLGDGSVGILLTIGLGLLVLLTQATSNRALYDRNYDRLYTVNMVVAGLLLLGLLWGASRLIIRLRQGQFGSRLLVKPTVVTV